MKLLPATVLLAVCVGWVPLALASAQPTIAECLNNHSPTGCVTVLPDDEPHVIDNLDVTTAAAPRSMEIPESFDAKSGIPSAGSSATASTVATLGLFGSALVILGFFRGKRSVHRQLG